MTRRIIYTVFTMARPSSYSKEMGEKILLRMGNGDSVRQICQDPDMPDKTTVNLWRITIEEFSRQYARARRVQVEARIEEANEIADNGTFDYRIVDGEKVFDKESFQRSKLRCEQRRWEASKLLRGSVLDAPLDYGERLELAGNVDVGLSERLSKAVKRVEPE